MGSMSTYEGVGAKQKNNRRKVVWKFTKMNIFSFENNVLILHIKRNVNSMVINWKEGTRKQYTKK